MGSDASFRRYFRLFDEGSQRSLIVMDAPPEHESCQPWLNVGGRIYNADIAAPEVLAADTDSGFILMSDLGEHTFKDLLTADPAPDEQRTHALYVDAIGVLVALQNLSSGGLPPYSQTLLLNEMRLFTDWYLARQLQFPLADVDAMELENLFHHIAAHNQSEAQVFVHRDYQIRNLIWRGDDTAPGVVDFQDAVNGPISYDILSLLKDAYYSLPEEVILDLLIRYWEAARKVGHPVPQDFSDFQRDFDFIGVQRHLKILGIFSRLAHRDQKPLYLQELPRILAWLFPVCQRYSELKSLAFLLERTHPDSFEYTYHF